MAAVQRDAAELVQTAVIDVVIFAPLTGLGRPLEPVRRRTDADVAVSFVLCARSSVG